MHRTPAPQPADLPRFVEDVEVRGHIIDSLILPKVLDVVIAARRHRIQIKNITIGSTRQHPSHALVEVRAPSEALLASDPRADGRPRRGLDHSSTTPRLVAADMAGAFPEEILQHDQSTNRSPTRRDTGIRSPTRRWIAASSSIRTQNVPAASP